MKAGKIGVRQEKDKSKMKNAIWCSQRRPELPGQKTPVSVTAEGRAASDQLGSLMAAGSHMGLSSKAVATAWI